MGLIHRYADWATNWTDAPYIYHLYGGMMITSVLLGHNVYCRYGGKDLSPALWVLLASAPRLTRRSTCIGLAERVVDQIRPEKVYPHEFRKEKFMSLLQECPDGGLFLREPPVNIGAATGKLIVFYDQPQKYYERVHTQEYRIGRPAISVFTEISIDELKQYFSDIKLRKFLKLFLVVLNRRSIANFSTFPTAPDADDVARIARKFLVLKGLEGEMTLTREARAVWDSWYQDHVEMLNMPGAEYPTLDELPTYLLKLSMIIQVADVAALETLPHKHLAITAAVMRVAIKWVTHIKDNIFGLKICANMPSPKTVKRGKETVKHVFKEAGLIPRAKARQKIHFLNGEAFDQITQQLVHEGYLRIYSEPRARRPRTMYQWIKKD